MTIHTITDQITCREVLRFIAGVENVTAADCLFPLSERHWVVALSEGPKQTIYVFQDAEEQDVRTFFDACTKNNQA